MRMGWLITLVLVIAATMPPIAVGQARAQERQTCSLPKGWIPAKDLPRILAEHREWAKRWYNNKFSRQWAKSYPEGRVNFCNAYLSEAILLLLTWDKYDGSDLLQAPVLWSVHTKLFPQAFKERHQNVPRFLFPG